MSQPRRERQTACRSRPWNRAAANERELARRQEELIRLSRPEAAEDSSNNLEQSKDAKIEFLVRSRDLFIKKFQTFLTKWADEKRRNRRYKQKIKRLIREVKNLRSEIRFQQYGSDGRGFTDYDTDSDTSDEGWVIEESW